VVREKLVEAELPFVELEVLQERELGLEVQQLSESLQQEDLKHIQQAEVALEDG
jgi:hypothetical protein